MASEHHPRHIASSKGTASEPIRTTNPLGAVPRGSDQAARGEDRRQTSGVCAKQFRDSDRNGSRGDVILDSDEGRPMTYTLHHGDAAFVRSFK